MSRRRAKAISIQAQSACGWEVGMALAMRPVMRKPPSRDNVALDHISLPVRRLAAARKFYEAALGAIGMKINMDVGGAFAMGSQHEKIFWISQKRGATGGAHHAFRVAKRADVDAFHRAALAAGGTDHGAPGPRPDYGPNYYAAFVKDPEGNNIETVCYRKPPKPRSSSKGR